MKTFTRIIHYIFFPAAFVWMVATLLSAYIPNNPLVSYLSRITQIPEEYLILKPLVGNGFDDFDTFMYSGLVYVVFAILSLISIIFGFFVLGKGRAWFEKLMLLQAFAIPRERITWGIVNDVATEKPIAFATLRIIQKRDGKDVVVTSTVSDLDGRYRMYVQLESGTYTLQVRANGYDDYLQSFNATGAGQNITANISLRAFSTKLYSESISNPLFSRDRLYTLLVVYVFLVSLLTFSHIAYSLFFHFGLVSVLNLIFYGFAALWNVYVLLGRSFRSPGKVVDKYTDAPIQSAQVLLFLNGKQVSSSISNSSGIVQFDVEPGMYEIKVSKQGYALVGSIDEAELFIASISSHGFLENNIIMTPLERDMTATTNLLNPFGA